LKSFVRGKGGAGERAREQKCPPSSRRFCGGSQRRLAGGQQRIHKNAKARGTITAQAWASGGGDLGRVGAFGEAMKHMPWYWNQPHRLHPGGSIYFGGTDAGLFIIAALQKSHVRAEPFFKLTRVACRTPGTW